MPAAAVILASCITEEPEVTTEKGEPVREADERLTQSHPSLIHSRVRKT